MSKRMTDQRIYEIKRWLSDEEIPWDEVPIAPTKKELLCALTAERDYWHSGSDIVKEAADHIEELEAKLDAVVSGLRQWQL